MASTQTSEPDHNLVYPEYVWCTDVTGEDLDGYFDGDLASLDPNSWRHLRDAVAQVALERFDQEVLDGDGEDVMYLALSHATVVSPSEYRYDEFVVHIIPTGNWEMGEETREKLGVDAGRGDLDADELRWQVAGLMNQAEDDGMDPDEVKETVIGYARGRMSERP